MPLSIIVAHIGGLSVPMREELFAGAKDLPLPTDSR